MTQQPASKSSASSRLAVFTDFDGTLVPLAARPEEVAVPDNLIAQLQELEQRLGGAFAIVTGRPMTAVDGFLAPARFATAAAHGTERRRADSTNVAPAPEMIAAAAQVHAALLPLAAADMRLVLEAKLSAVALHYRQAPELEASCRDSMALAVAGVEGFVVVEGKMVLEARPAGIDKGVALRAFMQEAPFRDRLPVFIGDDTTDEDGFAAAQALGGIGIKVGDGPTSAQQRLSDPTAVRLLLQQIAADDLGSASLAMPAADLVDGGAA